jgi:hypothetical protein
MKKHIVTLLFFISTFVFGQIKLVSTPVSLKKNADFHQLNSIINQDTNEICSFICDRENITAVLYNSAIFLNDSLKIEKPTSYFHLLGGSFIDGKNVISYWASQDYRKYSAVSFDFQNKTFNTQILYDLDLTNDRIYDYFVDKGVYYSISEGKTSKRLFLNSISEKKSSRKVLGFSRFIFKDENQKPTTLDALINEYGIVRIDENNFNNFDLTVRKIKYYLKNNVLFLILDHSKKATLVYQINLDDFSISEAVFNHPNYEQLSSTNSLLFDDKLVQLRNDKTKLEVEFFDLLNQSSLKKYVINDIEKNPFTFSSFFKQYSFNNPSEIKNTKKFLRQLNLSNLAFSSFRYNDNYYLTVGGLKQTISNAGIVFGALAVAGGVDLVDFENDYVNTSTFFNAVLDLKLEEVEPTFEPLFIDKLDQFLDENRNCSLVQYFPYKDYYILNYYDTKTKEIVLVKFNNGYEF